MLNIPGKNSKKLMGVGLGAGLLGAVFFALRYAIRPASKQPLPDTISSAVFTTKVAHTTLGNLIYHEAGSGQPLLFLHSLCLGGSSYEWSKVYPRFTGSHRVLALDLPGFGESQRPNVALTADDYVRGIAEVIRATCWGEAPTIVASGLTAGFCLKLANQHPELMSRLVLYLPTGGVDFGAARLRFGTRLAARWGLLQRFLYRNYQSTRNAVRHWLAEGGFHNPERLSEEAVEVFTTCAQQGGAENAIRNFHAGRLNLDLEAEVGAVTHPVTLLWTQETPYPPREYGEWLHSQLRHGRLVVLSEVGALGALENPELLGDALKEELDPGLRILRD